MASVGVAWCGTTLVGVRWPRWILDGLCGSSRMWNGLSGYGMVSARASMTRRV